MEWGCVWSPLSGVSCRGIGCVVKIALWNSAGGGGGSVMGWGNQNGIGQLCVVECIDSSLITKYENYEGPSCHLATLALQFCWFSLCSCLGNGSWVWGASIKSMSNQSWVGCVHRWERILHGKISWYMSSVGVPREDLPLRRHLVWWLDSKSCQMCSMILLCPSVLKPLRWDGCNFKDMKPCANLGPFRMEKWAIKRGNYFDKEMYFW